MKAAFEIIEHPADVGFRAHGATLQELFQNSALAMLSLGCAPEGVKELERREIAARAADLESLLFPGSRKFSPLVTLNNSCFAASKSCT